MDAEWAGSVNEQLRRPRRADLLRLTALRAFAALLVFGYHLGHDGVVGHVGPFRFGYVGVSFFFILSGFVLAWSTPVTMRPLEFFRRRVARIYPSHLAVLLIALVLPVVLLSRSSGAFLSSLFLVQAWTTKESITYGMNGVAWTLSCEMAFYVAFPFALRALLPRSSSRRWLMAGGWFAAEAIITVVAVLGHHGTLESAGVSIPVLRFGEFLLGMVAALEVRRGWRLRWEVAAGAVLVGLILNRVLTGNLTNLVNTCYVPAFLAMVVLAAQRDLDRDRGWLRAKWLVYAGQVSFAFYLVHELTIINLTHELGGGWAVAALALAVASLAAVAVHHGIELPCQEAIRKIPLPGRRALKEAAPSTST